MSDRPNVTVHPSGLVEYRASFCGSCSRALVAARRGENQMPHSDAAEARMAEGWRQEEYIKERLLAEGWESIQKEGQEEYRAVVIEGRIIIVGHLDDRLRNIHTHEEVIAEYKSMGDSVISQWLKHGAGNEHRQLRADLLYSAQCTAAMVGAAEVNGQRQRILYAGKERPGADSDPREGRWFYFLLDPDDHPMDWSTLRRRITLAETMAREDSITWPDCDTDSKGRFFCNFPHLHEAEVEEEVPELSALFSLAHSAQLSFDAAEDELKDIKKQIRSALEERELRKAVSSGVSISLRDFFQTRIDMDSLRADMGDGIHRYERSNPVKQVVIARKKAGEKKAGSSRSKKGE